MTYSPELQRVPSQNLEAEQSLLSALMINNEYYYDIDFLSADDFYKSAHQKIFTAIKNLIETKYPADLVTVVEYLQDKKELEGIGGASYLAKISDSAPVATNARAYGKIIKKCSVVRTGTVKAMELMEQGFNNPNPAEFIENFQRTAMELDSGKEDSITDAPTFSAWVKNKIKSDIEDANSDGLKTGFMPVDEITNITGSKLILIAARPKIGKTAFMTTVVRNMCEMFGYTVGVLSLEMDKKEIADRWVSGLANINPMRFRYSGGIAQSQLKDIEAACDYLGNWKLFIDDQNCNIEDVKRKCRKMKKLGCQAIFIDQISKISGGDKDNYTRFTHHCNQLALLKKELRLPIFLLCQIKRNTNEKPTMDELKQTGALEEDADMIFILHREREEKRKTELMLVAHRQGGTQDFILDFNPNRILFT